MKFLKRGQEGGQQRRRNFQKSLTNGAYWLPIKEGLKAFKWPSGHRKRRNESIMIHPATNLYSGSSAMFSKINAKLRVFLFPGSFLTSLPAFTLYIGQ